ncbi:hypothetical protein Q9R08_05530 [Microbacterium sp. QXD-8]|uniref:Bacterial spore germination immunoglobulin-like domain-containing protein n=1 Tax=Microbacterium psychrotolerans TaxID=3068321 RepID=A0ABU0YYL9_9MICO|nr:hypothetical protein [Microbacterium sp. QXD-8]MDQ7877434.1 hypothetical protein [Microbacterium sp. QXD-8]
MIVAFALATVSIAGCTSPPSIGGGGAAAACAAPIVEELPKAVAPDQTLTVAGVNWGPCNDTNQATLAPWAFVTIEWEQSGKSVEIGTIAIENFEFRGDVTVPADAVKGDVTLRIVGDDYEHEVPLVVESPQP